MIIDRRRFLATSGMCVAGGASSVAKALTMFLPGPSSSPARIVYPLNRGWLWSTETPLGAQERDFHDSAFTQVTLPHSNVFVPWHSIDQSSYQFVSTYRRHFKLPSQHNGRRVFVDFEGAATASKVWLNGTLLGEYFGSFTPFSFELTKDLDWSEENVLCVQVDSHELPEVPPFGYEIDYLTYGGIYREASIRVTSQTLIDNLQVRTLKVRSASPEAEIAVWLDSTETASSQPLYLLEGRAARWRPCGHANGTKTDRGGHASETRASSPARAYRHQAMAARCTRALPGARPPAAGRRSPR